MIIEGTDWISNDHLSGAMAIAKNVFGILRNSFALFISPTLLSHI